MDELTINGEVYIRKSSVADKMSTIDIAIRYLDKLKAENPNLEIIVDLPDNKGCTFKLKNCLIYEGVFGHLVFDGE